MESGKEISEKLKNFVIDLVKYNEFYTRNTVYQELMAYIDEVCTGIDSPSFTDHELNIARMESCRNSTVDNYFGARPYLDNTVAHVAFIAGFERGWAACRNSGE